MKNQIAPSTIELVEQLRDIYCGRLTYNDDVEWLDNVDAIMDELCLELGYDFAPQSGVKP